MLEDPITGSPKKGKEHLIMILATVIVIIMLFLAIPLIVNHVNQKLPPVTVSTAAYVTIELNNSEPEPTPANFDQLLVVPFASYHSYLNQQASNIRFYNSTQFSLDDELYAWLEDNDSNTSIASNVWVNLGSTIVPAHGSVNIYMVFVPKNSTWDPHWGLAPSLSASYGVYDNGNKVFPDGYWNFSSNASSSGWVITSGIVNDGLSLSRSGKGRAVFHFQTDIKDIVGIDQLQASGSSSKYSYSCLGVNNSINEAGWTESTESYVPSNNVIYPLEGNPQDFFTGISRPTGVWEVAGVYAGPLSTTFYYFGVPVLNASFNITGPDSIELWTGGPYGTNVLSDFVYMRAVPPNNVMPATSFQTAQ